MLHIFNESNTTGVIEMNHVIISTYSSPVQVQNYINKRLEPLYLKSYKPISHITVQSKVTFITYHFSPLLQSSYITPIAKGIADFIQQEFAKTYAADIIQIDYGFNSKENHKIREVLYDLYQSAPLLQQTIEECGEKEKLVKSISQAIEENNNFCVDGWIKFRLEEYKNHIRERVERVIFEYLAYQEYTEFIDLLKRFIETQAPLVNVLHLIPKGSGCIGLYNEDYKEMTPVILEQDTQISQMDENYDDDLILSIVLTISPLKLMIHKKDAYENKRLIQTIRMVYGSKVGLCKNCKHCEQTSDILT